MELREKQLHNYKTFIGPVRNSTVCRQAGCRRLSGRRGLFFCTEGCCEDPNSSCSLKNQGGPAPPFIYRDIDDENDASVVLQRVLGNPPLNVTYRRWQWDDEENQPKLVTNPPLPEEVQKCDWIDSETLYFLSLHKMLPGGSNIVFRIVQTIHAFDIVL